VSVRLDVFVFMIGMAKECICLVARSNQAADEQEEHCNELANRSTVERGTNGVPTVLTATVTVPQSHVRVATL